jgi:hypothetical protein
MRKTIYECDDCKGVIGDNTHISLNTTHASGIAIPTVKGPYVSWAIKPSLGGSFLHFCSVRCLSRYFTKLMKASNGKKTNS